MSKSGTILLAFLLIAGLVAQADPASARSEKAKGSMSSTGVDADARGSVKLAVRNQDDGKFEVRVQNLDPSAPYDVVVGGVLVGRLTTSGSGSGRLRFRSRPKSRDALLGFDPRGVPVVVRDASGQAVLAIALASRSGVDGEDIICCVPDDSGPECEDRTPTECAAQGGTVTTATSCLPNPCTGTPPPTVGDIVCCIPDDSGPECEDRTAAQCAAQGGVVVAAASCTPNPCSTAVAPVDDDIQCCLPDDSGPECEDRTVVECAIEGGVNAGAGACTPNPCDTIPPPSGNATVTVKCEVRAGRSKISVDGNNLANGSYQARVTSGANTATAPAHQTIGDEVEFDFDSNGTDIAAGATAIGANFIQGAPPQVTGMILTLGGNVVVQATGNCLVR